MWFNNKKKKFYQRLIDKIDEGRWNAELRIKVVKAIREGIRKEFDRVSDTIKAITDQIEKMEASAPKEIKSKKEYEKDKENREILKSLKENQARFQLDADKMKEQMMGKWIESEQQYHGGLDEEIKSIEGNVVGGEEFKNVILNELKKL